MRIGQYIGNVKIRSLGQALAINLLWLLTAKGKDLMGMIAYRVPMP
jgi:hypothetical protein